MKEMYFLQSLHNSSKRNYLERMNAEKPDCMRVAKQYGYDYWDGDRKYGFGGWKHDGRWKHVAEKMAGHYNLEKSHKFLDIGCGKGGLLGELTKIAPDSYGIDISKYAIARVPDGLWARRDLSVKVGNCTEIPYSNAAFDFTYSINVFHNLGYRALKQAIQEMVRVTKPDGHSYICVESYRTEEELQNLQCWALTCRSFYSPDDWKEILAENGYKGDVELIFFE